MATWYGSGRRGGAERSAHAPRALTALCTAAAVTGLAACGPAGAGHRSASGTIAATPVTAVAATSPPTSPWNSIPGDEQGSRLGPWVLQGWFLVLAALGDQGLATVSRQRKSALIVFRGDLSIPPSLRQEGWDHVGDPDSWHGYLFDAYQKPGGEKLFEVTTPSGYTHDFIHPLVSHEGPNNSFVAVTPDGQWMVSGEWGEVDRLLVFPTPIINPDMPVQAAALPLAATIRLDHPVRDVQGCAFDSPTQMLCSSTDPATDLWPTPDQLLQVTLNQPLDGKNAHGRVGSLGELPRLSACAGSYEPEGIDYDSSTRTLRVEVIPPGRCGLSVTVYDYRGGNQ